MTILLISQQSMAWLGSDQVWFCFRLVVRQTGGLAEVTDDWMAGWGWWMDRQVGRWVNQWVWAWHRIHGSVTEKGWIYMINGFDQLWVIHTTNGWWGGGRDGGRVGGWRWGEISICTTPTKIKKPKHTLFFLYTVQDYDELIPKQQHLRVKN